MRQRRRSMSFAAQRFAAKELARRVIRLQGLAHAHRIGAYLATDGEIDPLPTLIELMRRKRRCLLPVMVPGRRPRIRFASFNLNSRLIANRFKINEPAVPRQNWLDARELDIVLVPLVAFDAQGNVHLLDAHTLPSQTVIILELDSQQVKKEIYVIYYY